MRRNSYNSWVSSNAVSIVVASVFTLQRNWMDWKQPSSAFVVDCKFYMRIFHLSHSHIRCGMQGPNEHNETNKKNLHFGNAFENGSQFRSKLLFIFAFSVLIMIIRKFVVPSKSSIVSIFIGDVLFWFSSFTCRHLRIFFYHFGNFNALRAEI